MLTISAVFTVWVGDRSADFTVWLVTRSAYFTVWVVTVAGSCDLCSVKVALPCQCGKEVQEVICSESLWSCLRVCGEPLSCGHHSCLRVSQS